MLERRTEDLRGRAPNPVIWQYESPNYEVASSLSSLSLLAPEVPTQPQPPIPAAPKPTRRLPALDEVDTVPSVQPVPPVVHRGQGPAHSLALTTPRFATAQESTPRSIIPAPVVVEPREAASWTAGAGSDSIYARIISGSVPGVWRRRQAFNPLDNLRWWLLRPGRMEFLLWLGGTLMLVVVTCALLFALAFSFEGGAGMAGVPTGSGPQNAAVAGKANQHNKLPHLQVVLTSPGPYAPGNQISVRGQGFSPHSSVSFTLDSAAPILDRHANPALLPTDAHGAFSGTLWLGIGPAWTVGHHSIVVRDKATGRQFTLPITLVPVTNLPSSTTQGTSSSSSTTPGTSPTIAVTTTPGVQATPGSNTPVPSTPTPISTHTPTATPTVTSTAAASPTPTKSVTVTPTSTETSHATPGATPQNSFTSALNQSGDPPIASPLSTSSPLVWIMTACYTLSILLLGAAGILYKRRPREAKTAASR